MKVRKVEIEAFANYYPDRESKECFVYMNAEAAEYHATPKCTIKAIPCRVIFELPERKVEITESEFDKFSREYFAADRDYRNFREYLKQKLFPSEDS